MYDTSPDMEARMKAMIAKKSPEERLRMACSMIAAAKTLVRSGIIHEDNTLTEAQIRGRMFLRFYGNEFSPKEIRQIISKMPNMEI
jgi:hypothetical protein